MKKASFWIDVVKQLAPMIIFVLESIFTNQTVAQVAAKHKESEDSQTA